jgi:nitrite reductase/ring-hydroxylating ferredoxin subunit
MSQWIEACAANDIDKEDVIRFDHDLPLAGRQVLRYRRLVHA